MKLVQILRGSGDQHRYRRRRVRSMAMRVLLVRGETKGQLVTRAVAASKLSSVRLWIALRRS